MTGTAKSAARKALEKLPGYSMGVRDNAAVRMVKLARPICPNSKISMVKDSDGKWVPRELQLPNCQLAKGTWWIDCEARGHEPYFTNRVWYEVQDRLETEIDPVTGEEFETVTGQKRIKHVNRYPNIAQVSLSIRHNSGRGAEFKIARHGFKRLGELGFEEVCQFRNCQVAVSKPGHGGVYGNYCGREHLMLAAADQESVMLHMPEASLNGEEFEKVKKLRRKQLREAITDVG